MQTVDVKNHDRIRVETAERSTLGYLWTSTGGMLLLTLAMTCIVVYSALFDASAGQARVVSGSGKGLYNASSTTPLNLPDDATPRQIVDYLLDASDPDLSYPGDTAIVRRILSSRLLTRWRQADEAAARFDEPLLDMNWITTGQDFELESRAIQVEGDAVVARLKGKAGEMPTVTFDFVRQGDAWRISDVVYGEGPEAYPLTSIFDGEVEKDKRTPFVQLPITSGRWTNGDCRKADAATTRIMSPGRSSTSGDDCIAKATSQGGSLYALQLLCADNDGSKETHYYQVDVNSTTSMTWLFRDGHLKDPMELRYCEPAR